LRIRSVAGNIEIRKLDSRSLEDLKSREETSWNRWQERQAEKNQQQREREKERRERQREKEEDRDQD